jgi:hypothetical protein
LIFYILDIYNLRNYDEIFHAPICESENHFKGIQNLMKRDKVKFLDDIRGIASNVEIAVKMAKNGL